MRKRGRRRRPREAGAFTDLGREHPLEFIDAGPDHSRGTQPVAIGAGMRVRKPFRPFPLRERRVICGDEDLQVLRIVQSRRVEQHRPGEAACRLLAAGDLDARVIAERHAERQIPLRLVREHQPVGSGSCDRIELGEGRQLRRLERDAERLVADPHPHGEEVGVVGAAFADACALLGEVGQSRGGWQLPVRAAALLMRCHPDRRAQVGEIRQVLPPRGEGRGLSLGALAPTVDEDEAERRQEDHSADQKPGRAGVRHADHHDGADAAQHGEHRCEHVGALVGLELGWRLHGQTS